MGVERPAGLGAGWRKDELHPISVISRGSVTQLGSGAVPTFDSTMAVLLLGQEDSEETLMPSGSASPCEQAPGPRSVPERWLELLSTS